MHNGTLETPPPAFSTAQALSIATRFFGLSGQVSQLVSERDQNFHLRTELGRQFVLKIANPAEDRRTVDFQVRALQHLAAADPELPVPRVCASQDGPGIIVVHGDDGAGYLARMVTYIDGEPLGNTEGATSDLHAGLGVLLARLGRALRGYFHPAARHELLWDMKQALRLREILSHLPDSHQRDRVGAVLESFATHALPVLPGLRAQVIHNDLNPDNLLVDPANPDRITGVIDFGDLVHSPLIVDIAVAAAYQLAGTGDPLAPVGQVVRAYHSVTPLEESELAILFDLIATRVATSVAISGWRAARYPANADYILTSHPRAIRMLDRLAQISRADAADYFREVCGATCRSVSSRDGRPLEPLQPKAASQNSSATRRQARSPAGNRTDDGTAIRHESDEELIARRERALGPAYRLFYDRPLHIVRGEGVWLYDAAGNAFLDVYNNVAHVGHCHPRVVEAITRQTASLNTHTRYLHRTVVDYAERLGALFPFDDPVCLFCCTGSEATELAYRIAMAHTGGTGVLVTTNSYHGNSSTVAQFSTSDTPLERRGQFVQTISAPDAYRGAYRHGRQNLAAHFAAEVSAAAASLRDRGMGPAMLLVDTVFSCDGVVSPPEGYLADAVSRIRAAGGLYVADEVQAGFGRTGEAFWGFERYRVRPDIVTLGKPMGNGYPLAAVVCPRKIVEAFAGQIDYFNTFGGNPVASAAGMAVLDVIESEDLQHHADEVGRYLRMRLNALKDNIELIGDVRGAGLFVGVELVEDRQTLTPARDVASAVVNALRQRGILIGATGPNGNVLKLRPPMVFSKTNADALVDNLESVFDSRSG